MQRRSRGRNRRAVKSCGSLARDAPLSRALERTARAERSRAACRHRVRRPRTRIADVARRRRRDRQTPGGALHGRTPCTHTRSSRRSAPCRLRHSNRRRSRAASRRCRPRTAKRYRRRIAWRSSPRGTRSVHVIVSGRGSPSAPAARLPLGTALLGRAIDAAGSALDGGGALRGLAREPVIRSIAPAERRTIDVPLWTGVRSIDGLLTIGRGARVGIFGAPGAGKSTLLALLLAHARTDAIVFGLIGE